MCPLVLLLITYLTIDDTKCERIDCDGTNPCGPCTSSNNCELICDTHQECMDYTLECESNEQCFVGCYGSGSACKDATINAAQATDLYIDCIGYQVCSNTIVNAGYGQVTVVCDEAGGTNCDGLQLHAENAQDVNISCPEYLSCANMDIWCGVGHCILNCSGQIDGCQGLWIDARSSSSFTCIGEPCENGDITSRYPTKSPTIYTSAPTTNRPTTMSPTTSIPTTQMPTTSVPTTLAPTTTSPTTVFPTTVEPSTEMPTTVEPSTSIPTTTMPTIPPTTNNPTTFIPTTYTPTTTIPTTATPTIPPTTTMPTTIIPTTMTFIPTTYTPTTIMPTTTTPTSNPSTVIPTVFPTSVLKDESVMDTTQDTQEKGIISNDNKIKSDDDMLLWIIIGIGGVLVIIIIILLICLIYYKHKPIKKGTDTISNVIETPIETTHDMKDGIQLIDYRNSKDTNVLTCKDTEHGDEEGNDTNTDNDESAEEMYKSVQTPRGQDNVDNNKEMEDSDDEIYKNYPNSITSIMSTSGEKDEHID